jgi:hypothetical protein
MGYKEGLLPSEIANIKNLCITKRKNNSSKGFKTEYVFKKQKSQPMYEWRTLNQCIVYKFFDNYQLNIVKSFAH